MVLKETCKRKNWFLGEVKELIQRYFQKKMKDTLTSENKIDCMVKIINRYYKIVWLKSKGRFREHQRIPSNKLSELIDVVKRKRILAFVANFSLRWLYNDETRHIPTKSRKSINSSSNRICNPIANVSVKVQYANISNLKPNLQIKKFNPNSRAPIFTNSMNEKRSVSKFFRLSEKSFSTSFNTCTHPKMFKFFPVSAGQKYVSDTKRDTND